MAHYSAGFLFSNDHQKVVLVRKLKPNWQMGKLNGVGGCIERGETPHQAMAREFDEECDLNNLVKSIYGHPLTTPEDWVLFCSLILRNGDKIDFFYTINDVALNIKPRTDEDVLVVPVNDLNPNECLWSVPWLISMAVAMIEGKQNHSFMIIEKWGTGRYNNGHVDKGV